MKKDKKLENVIKTNMPIVDDASRWITQPFNYSMIGGDMSLMQIKIMTSIVDKLQVRIKQALNSENHLDLFTNDEYSNGEIGIKIDFKDFGIPRQKYKDIDSAFQKLMGLVFESKSEDPVTGIFVKELIHPFKRIRSVSGSQGKKNFAIFYFEKDDYENIFNLNRYHTFLKSIVSLSRSQYTCRLYILLSAYRVYRKWTVSYSDLRTLLVRRGVKTIDDKGRSISTWDEGIYPEYRIFKAKVLNTAEREIKEMADNGEIDFYFSYDEVRPSGKKTGEPDKIIFNIHLTSIGKVEEERIISCRYLIDAENVLRSNIHLAPSAYKKLLSYITSDNVESFKNKVRVLAKELDERQDISDIEKYAYKSLLNFVEGNSEKEVRYISFVQEESQLKVADVPSYDAELWKSVWKSLAEENSGAVIYEDAIKIVEVNDSAVVISYPSRTTFEMVSREFGTLIQDRIGETFSRKVEITIKN